MTTDPFGTAVNGPAASSAASSVTVAPTTGVLLWSTTVPLGSM
jgi:hypothetical protein